MVRKVVIGAVVCVLISGGTIYAQQVEIPREKAGKIVQQTKRPVAQPIVEVRPQTVAFTETSNLNTPRLSVEQMRQAGALAAQKVKEEDHDIEADSSEPDVPAPSPSRKKEISANAVRPIDRPSRESEPLSARSISFSGQMGF